MDDKLMELNLANLKRLSFEEICLLYTSEYTSEEFKKLIRQNYFSSVKVKTGVKGWRQVWGKSADS